MKPLAGWDRTSWLASLSLSMSVVALVLPVIFTFASEDGFLPYYPINILLGIAAGGIARFLKSWKLFTSAVLAALSPLLVVWVLAMVEGILYAITGGRFELV
ncbi:MAG: hypothetical protein Q4A82_07720 [Corynebacterium sp.]|nr:hypothetical protein [Corynebacterium sp.]